jgi:hypothetical protein
MSVAQGQLKKLSYKKQTGLGSAASGSGGQYLTRETASFNLKKDTFTSNQITTHQQYVGDAYGVSKTEGSLDSALMPGAFAPFMGSAVRKDFAAISAITGLSITIAGSGPFTLTDASATFLTDGVKIGHVIRITAGTYTGVARDINLLVTAVTETVITVIVPNGKDLDAQGPVASSTVSIVGKATHAPTSGHTNDYYTFEEDYADIGKVRTYTDVQVGTVEIAVPATGNSTVKLSFLGLGRTKGTSATLTSPTAELASSIVSASNGCILIAGSRLLTGTSANLKIENGLAHGEAVIGSRVISDLVKGEIKASGTVTAVKDGETNSDLYDNETAANVIVALFLDNSDDSDFIAFVVPRAKLMSDDVDDGKKQLVETFNFTGEYNASGGDALANDATTIGIQDSLAA